MNIGTYVKHDELIEAEKKVSVQLYVVCSLISEENTLDFKNDS